MTDTTTAPPQAAPVSPASPPSSSPANEVVINQAPVDSPNPVGPQAPDKPDAERRRESVEKAFQRANSPPPKGSRVAEKPAAKPAEARMGHNQPPEDTPKERIDLKKRPADQPPRAEHGHFAPHQRPDLDNVQNAMKGMNGTQQPGSDPTLPGQTEYKRLPPHAPFAEPPGRIAEHARRDWADTPETVRGEVHRMNHEFGRAVQQYRGAAEAFQPIARYHQMAQEHGTTLERALGNYTSMEAKLRADPIAGLDVIVNNLGLTDPQTGQPLGLRDVAYTVLSQSPDQLRQVQQGNAQAAASHQIGALHQEIAGLKNTLQQWQTAQQFSYTRSQVDQFAEGHPRFDELGAQIEAELKLGFTLEQAYQRAELLQPATQAAQTRTPSAQTRNTDRSISGSPGVAPSNGASRRPKEASASPRDAVKNAMQRLGGMH